ncbi:hypothetical protein KAT36_01315 [Candidatus Pacearchaeota archaeon]|nr:hypothetical protein [Candidatus Pacearchaeota archaeon]
MAIEDVLKRRYLMIDDERNSDKKVVSCFCDLISSNYEVLSGIFSSVIDKQFKENLGCMIEEMEEKGFDAVKQEFFEDGLYVEVSDMIRELNSKRNRGMGATIYGEEVKTPDVQFGLSEYFRSGESAGGGILNKGLTKKGINVVNLYRKARGLSSLE